MFFDIECPTPAYKQLVSSGIYERIKDKRKQIDNVLLYNSPYSPYGDTRFGESLEKKAKKEILNPNGKITQRRETFQDILNFFENYNSYDIPPMHEDFERILFSHPSFLAWMVLGKELFNFESFGFTSRRALEESITSFCLGENEFISESRDTWVWRRGDRKNIINLNVHGDLYAAQIDVSGKDAFENTLFGNSRVFDTFKIDPKRGAISAYQDWSHFLVASLRYAEETGQARMPEITEWRDVLGQVGAEITNTAEALFGGGDFGLEFLMERSIAVEGKKLDGFPLGITYDESHFLPYVKDDKLIYFKECKDGEPLAIFRGTSLEDKGFTLQIEYEEEDLPQILRATYRFFARDRRLLPKIMDLFLKNSNG